MSSEGLQGRSHKVLLPLLFLLRAATLGYCQQSPVDLNIYYQFPLSVGVEYQSLTPLADYSSGSPFTLLDIGLSLRWPVPPLPVLQPSLRMGLMRFDSQGQGEPLKWDHTDVYAQLGLLYAQRFAKNFEIGAELLAGISESLYSNLIPQVAPPLGNPNLLLEAGARISLNPSYSFTVEIHPSVKYLVSLGELKEFDGLIFGIGFTGNFRFGQDPDAPQGQIRAIRFEKANIPHAFAAMQSWYSRNPIGTVTLVNIEKASLTDLEVSFYQAGEDLDGAEGILQPDSRGCLVGLLVVTPRIMRAICVGAASSAFAGVIRWRTESAGPYST